VITAEEIGTIGVFAPLSLDARERLARAAADITLTPGEDAAPQGSERALFAVLSGQIKAFRNVDGVENEVGVRNPGEIFGEVPITLGTVFPVAFRAVAPSRVMRLDPTDYYAVAAAVPEIAAEVGRLASHRMTGATGLQGLAAPPPPRAIVLGSRWDESCGELRRFLDRNRIPFRWLRYEDPDAAAEWEGLLPPETESPVLRVIGGETVVRPPLRQVAELLGLTTKPKPGVDRYDTIVIGAGPAGLAAAVYGASEGLQTIVVERQSPGGQAGASSRIENYLGFPSGVSGDELASRALHQAQRLGSEILVTRTITSIDPVRHQVHLDGGDVLDARTIILALGVAWRRLEAEGFDRLAGKGIFYGAARSDAAATHGLDVHIVGAGNSAGQAALYFSTYARNVTMIIRGASLEKSMSRYLVEQLARRPNIWTLFGTEVVAAHGDSSLEAIEVSNGTGKTQRLESGGLFIMIGADAETSWLPPQIAVDDRGYVLTGSDVRDAGRWELERDPYLLETSVPGIFACGDVRLGPVKRVAAAVGEGSMAIAFVHQYLKEAGA
jgi:thioredoxin reductase (NADPH)